MLRRPFLRQTKFNQSKILLERQPILWEKSPPTQLALQTKQAETAQRSLGVSPPRCRGDHTFCTEFTKNLSLLVDSARTFIALPSGTAAVPPLIESCVRRSILVARPGFLGSQVPAWICPPAAERSPAVASAADVSRDQQRSKTKNSSDDGGRRPHRQPQPTNAATCMEGRSHQATQDSPKLKRIKIALLPRATSLTILLPASLLLSPPAIPLPHKILSPRRISPTFTTVN